MANYYLSESGSIFKVQGEGAFIYSKVTHSFEKCNLYGEILRFKENFQELSKAEALHLIRKEDASGAPPTKQYMKLHEAIQFACVAHEGQMRKGTKIPYIVHPFEVAQILTDAGAEEDVIIAGLLHDTLEDTGTSKEELEQRFGKRVRMLVEDCTQEEGKSWEERKQNYVNYLETKATLDNLMISCADKLANLRSTKANYLQEGEAVWNRFNRGKQHHCWYFSKLIDAFSPLQDYAMFWELNTIYKELFVSYFKEKGTIYQSNGQESYCYQKSMMKWQAITTPYSEIEKLEPISIADANHLIEQWEDEAIAKKQ